MLKERIGKQRRKMRQREDRREGNGGSKYERKEGR
jgi:hypothetical protein